MIIIALVFLIFSLLLGFAVVYEVNFISGFLKKLPFAIVIGFFINTWIVFLISLIFKFTIFSILFSSLISLVIIIFLFKKKDLITRIKRDLKTDSEIKIKKWLSQNFLFIIVLFVLFLFFFCGLWYDSKGNFLAINGYNSDLPFHMAIINSFIYQPDFPPENPIAHGSKMTYPFMVDFMSAILIKGGFDIVNSIKIPSVILIFCLAFITYIFINEITRNTLKTNIAIFLFFFCGIGLPNLIASIFHLSNWGVPCELNFFDWDSLHSVIEYPFFNFTHVIVNIFHPQRSQLIGFPIALTVFLLIYKNWHKINKKELLFAGFLTGLLPFFHTHSCIAIFIVFLIYFFYKRDKDLIYFIVPAAGFGLMQVLWLIQTPVDSNNFFSFIFFEPFWKGETILGTVFTHILFWLRTIGLPIILGTIGFFMVPKKTKQFFIPFFIIFLMINFIKFQPSFGNNNKLTLFFLLFLCIFSSYFLVKLLRTSFLGKLVSGIIIFLIVMNMFFTIHWSFIKAPFIIHPIVYTSAAFEVGDWVIKNTDADSVFLENGTHLQHIIPSLTGRSIVKGAYAPDLGLIKEKNIDFQIEQIYKTGNCNLIKKYNIDYILVGPHEKEVAIYDFDHSKDFELVFKYDQEVNNTFKIYKVRCE